MSIKRVRIVSNNICYGPCPMPDTEVEQHLTITSTGRVYFTSYLFGCGFGLFQRDEIKNFSIPREKAQRILRLIEKYFTEDNLIAFATDIGSWNMDIINENNEKTTFSGSLCCRCIIEDTDISVSIRENLDMTNLFLFDGSDE